MQEVAAVARQVFEIWRKGDFAGRPDLLSPDIVVSWSEPPVTMVSRGAAEVTKNLTQLFRQWDGFRAEAEEMIPVGESSVLVTAHQFGTGRGSGVDVDSRVYIVVTVRDGLVTEVHWHFEREKALSEAGLA